MNVRTILPAMVGLILAVGAPCARADFNAKEILWEVHLGHHVDGSPAIAADGTIYTTACGPNNYADFSGGKLAAISRNGEKKWIFETKTDTQSSPAIGADGTIYFGSRDKRVYAVLPDGREKWRFETGAWVDASPGIGADGTVYIGSWDNKFYALTPDGRVRWSFSTGGPVDSSAAIGADGVIYFGSHDKNFYALNPDGSLKWKFATAGVIISSPAIHSDGTIYFTSTDGKLYAMNPDGSVKWQLWTGGVHHASPALDEDGSVYLAVNNEFWGITPDGKKRWAFGYPEVEGSATLAADGVVYYAGQNAGAGTLFGFTRSGESTNSTYLKGGTFSSATIAPDGMIYVGAEQLLALKGSEAMQKSSWPKFRCGLRQTGRVGSD